MNAITVRGLTKTYGRVEALRGVELDVPEGSIFGLLGPNGAGKSTLIKALVGALRPSAGSVAVLGHDPLAQKAALRPLIGYMPQGSALYADLSARENLRFFGSAHRVPDLAARIDAALGFTELTARADDPVYGFSGGMKKRVSLACALLHEPRILLLDEPTAAVDPHLKVRSWAMFRELAARGVTLFVSTHLMDEALLCDRLAVLQRGRIIAVDTPAALLQRGRTRLRVAREGVEQTSQIGSAPRDLAAALHAFGLPAEVESIGLEADSLETVVLGMINEEAL
ncbi:MAG TPA: ABC transporter ATP-binding protein [Herpetosiphonaceae bacterium]|nr:ABC transporter ATP-binding protein [Herpetosiphonaceae bacterium]